MHTMPREAMDEIGRLSNENQALRESIELLMDSVLTLTDRAAQSRDSIVRLRQRLVQIRDEREAYRKRVSELEGQLELGQQKADAYIEGVHEGWVRATESLLGSEA